MSRKEKFISGSVVAALVGIAGLLIACYGKADSASEQSHKAVLKVVEVEKDLIKRIETVDDGVQAVLAAHEKDMAVREEMDKTEQLRDQTMQATIDRIADRVDKIPLAGGE